MKPISHPPRVFVVNEPLKTNRETGAKGRAIDLRPAQRFGELVFLSEAGEPPLDPSAWLPRMRSLLADFREGDFLLPVGHPALLVAAAAMIGFNNAVVFEQGDSGTTPVFDTLRVLVWGGREVGYVPARLPLFAPVENHSTVINPQSQEIT